MDWNFFYWTVSRGKATLRTSNKKNREPQKIVSVLSSYSVSIPESCQMAIYDTGVENSYKQNLALKKMAGKIRIKGEIPAYHKRQVQQRFQVTRWRQESVTVKGKPQNRYRDLKSGRFIKKP